MRRNREISTLEVDGGIINSLEFRKILSTIIGANLEIRDMIEVTALGAALLAGLAQGVYKDLNDIKKCVKEDVTVVKPSEEEAEYC